MNAPATAGSPGLRRALGPYALAGISLGTIIGSGWLLGAYTASSVAGPASTISWVLAAGMLILLALVHAELGSAYPRSGGTARFPAVAFGRLTGTTAGWAGWLQAVFIAPIEVEASISYLDSLPWVDENFALVRADATLSTAGLVLGSAMMVVFTVINLVGVRFMANSNGLTVVWKTGVPVLTVIVLALLSFHPGNFTAGGGFAPFGVHGIFAALPAGVVFALEGFEQAIQLGGESVNPQRNIPIAVISATVIGAVLYIALQVVFLGAVNPADLVDGWGHPMSDGGVGPYATLATAAGAGWLAWILYADAVVSPAGSGLLYVGSSARLSYAMGRAGDAPATLGKIGRNGVPVSSVLLAFVVGELAFLPFPSWQSLVALVTSATAFMYAFAPVTLGALRLSDPHRERPYRLPAVHILAPASFACANLIIYWGGFDTTWKIVVALLAGTALSRLGAVLRKDAPPAGWRNAAWIAPWLGGLLLIGWLGRYHSGLAEHGGELNLLPPWIDLLVVIGFSIAVYRFAVRRRLAAVTDAETEPVELTEPAAKGRP